MPEYDFDGQVAFVTGSAHGIGRSIAQYYAKNGADVVATDLAGNTDTVLYDQGTNEELEETASLVESEGQDVLTLGMDVRDGAQVEAAVEEAIDHFGRIDILANNAGIIQFEYLTELDEAEWDDTLDTNLKGAWLCSKHVANHFIERGGGGKIVSTASTAAHVGQLGCGHYAASKHGLSGLTKTFAIELAEHDVNVNAVSPTATGTPMIPGLMESYGEDTLEKITDIGGPFNLFDVDVIEPSDISEAYMWLSSDAARYVTGVTLPVDGGFSAK
ncbi:mycofactocin-coupled SDR family oxidoreductase [Haloglomus litoreum]|uniref:mycofactocin-coupled SDR family oxidoreductase n=1 Tax=Haloglomus litoreum TaxID=3034026 RepID=UPI0023E7D207|nr:mycofactocin-coupled SDR family oxidoreductase [Haloglomus sp. DT116]